MRGWLLSFWPSIVVEFSVHEDFGEAKEPNPHLSRNAPAAIQRNPLRDYREIILRIRFSIELRQLNIKVLRQLFCKGQIGFNILFSIVDGVLKSVGPRVVFPLGNF